MTLVTATLSDDLRLILSPQSDRRAPFDEAATPRTGLAASALLAPSVEASGPKPRHRKAALRLPATRALCGGEYRLAKGVNLMNYDHFRILCASAGAATALLAGAATTALAQQSPTTTIVGERAIAEGRSVHVRYGDLNLVAADDAQILMRRVKGAARFVCQPNDDQLVYRPFTACVTYARDGAQPQVDLAVRRAREIASNGNSAIPLVAIAVVGMR